MAELELLDDPSWAERLTIGITKALGMYTRARQAGDAYQIAAAQNDYNMRLQELQTVLPLIQQRLQDKRAAKEFENKKTLAIQDAQIKRSLADYEAGLAGEARTDAENIRREGAVWDQAQADAQKAAEKQAWDAMIDALPEAVANSDVKETLKLVADNPQFASAILNEALSEQQKARMLAWASNIEDPITREKFVRGVNTGDWGQELITQEDARTQQSTEAQKDRDQATALQDDRQAHDVSEAQKDRDWTEKEARAADERQQTNALELQNVRAAAARQLESLKARLKKDSETEGKEGEFTDKEIVKEYILDNFKGSEREEQNTSLDRLLTNATVTGEGESQVISGLDNTETGLLTNKVKAAQRAKYGEAIEKLFDAQQTTIEMLPFLHALLRAENGEKIDTGRFSQIKQKIATLSGFTGDPDLVTFEQAVSLLAQFWNRVESGAAINEQEVKRIQGLLPSIGYSWDRNVRTLKNLTEELEFIIRKRNITDVGNAVGNLATDYQFGRRLDGSIVEGSVLDMRGKFDADIAGRDTTEEGKTKARELRDKYKNRGQ